MEELAAAWVGWVRHRNAVQDKVIQLVQQTDARFEHDADLRNVALQLLRESFYRVAIADKLLESGRYASCSAEQLLSQAECIRDKRGYKALEGARSADMRTPEEERYYSTVRVRWSNLLKRARVAAADPRGGDTSMYRLSGKTEG
jgi:hypothetical protein